MEEVIATIQHITRLYSRTVLLENRFLNIFKDLYPCRMDKDVFSLFSEIVKRGYLKQILNIKKRNLKKEIDSISNSLIKDGHDEKNVHNLLCAIIVGTNVATKQDYSEALKGQTCPKYPNSSTSLNFGKMGLNILHYVLLFLFLILICSTPYLYICALRYLWPFWATTIIIIFCGIAIIAYGLMEKAYSSFQKGCFLGLMTCLSFLLCIFPSLTDLYAECGLFNYWSPDYFVYQAEMSFITILYSIIVGTFFIGLCFEGIRDSLKKKKQNINNKKSIVLGIVSAISCYTIFMYMIITIPYYQKKSEFDSYNTKNKELKQSRQNISKSLSFCGIKLGDNFERCFSIVRSNMKDIELESGKVARHFSEISAVLDTTDYSVVVDSVIKAQAFWDNQNVRVNLYFNRGKNIAIKVTELTQNPLPLFMSKYGRAEYIIPNLDYDETLTSKFEDHMFLYEGYGYQSYKYERLDYRWTFKNSIISIKYFGKDSYSSYILYLNRECENLYSDYRLNLEKSEKEKRRQDSINVIRERQKQQRKAAAEKKREVNNHKRALNEI